MAKTGVVISKIQGVTIVSFRVTSILDGVAIQDIGEQLYPIVDEQAARKLVLDFSAVRFLASAMIGVIMTLHKKSKAIKGEVILCGLRPELHKVFKIMRLEKMLRFAKNESEALGYFDVFLERE